ncbi:MAG TPA: DUF6230 family protein [Streptosporangiaceae bacterium]|nr:DUF6230 family protein [Streptosporangiaceae bacterium]
MRWKRFAFVMVPSAIVAAALIGLTAEGAIGANISVSGQEYTVTANQLSGNGFEQFGSTVKSGDKQIPVAESAIRSAKLTNLCQAVKIGSVTLLLRAGRSSGHPVSASNLIVDASSLSGDASFHNIAIGQDAGTLNEDPGATGTPGSFGEQADTVTINHLVQNTWLTTAGTFTLPGLRLNISTNGGSCP